MNEKQLKSTGTPLQKHELLELSPYELNDVFVAVKKTIFDKDNPIVDRIKHPGEPNVVLSNILGFKNSSAGQRIINSTDATKNKERVKCLTLLIEKYTLDVYKKNDKFRVAGKPSSSPDFFEKLAGKLSLNLVDISTAIGDERLPLEQIFKKRWLWEKREKEEVTPRERFIAVLGSGASHAATPRDKPYLLADHTIKHIRESFENGHVSSKVIDRLVKKLVKSRVITAQNNYETQLTALLRLDSERVYDELRKLCGYKDTPSLVYEIIAHLFKHRFFDAIINFNYDELLDNAISEEMPNQEGYRFIHTPGQCPDKLEDLYIENRLKLPLYIKTHGTISHANSLQLGEGNAIVMESAIQQHIEELMIGKVPQNNAAEREELPLNLIFFGFSMQNSAFTALLKNVLREKDKKINIYIFDTDPKLPAFIRSQLYIGQAEQDAKLNVESAPLLTDHYDLERNLEKLWVQIEEMFQKPYIPKGIERHQLINHVFRGYSPITLMNDSKRKIYHQDRLFVEIGLLMIESDGIIHLKQLSGGRVGKFYEKLKAEPGSRSIHSYLKRMGLVPYKRYMYDTYYIEDSETRNNKNLLIEHVRTNLLKSVEECKGALKGDNKKRFVELAELTRKRRLLLINPQYRNVHDNLFSNVGVDDVMNTSLAWIFNYRRMMTEDIDKWDVMLTISEQGRFLNYDIERTELSDKYFEIILAKNNLGSQKSEQEEILEGGKLKLLTGLRYRPWWVHNKHMVIFLKKRKNSTGDWRKDWKRVKGFYYTHYQLSRRINPIRVENEKDLELMMIMFAIYWEGSSPETLSESIPLVTENSVIDRVLNDLLSKYPENKST